MTIIKGWDKPKACVACPFFERDKLYSLATAKTAHGDKEVVIDERTDWFWCTALKEQWFDANKGRNYMEGIVFDNCPIMEVKDEEGL